MSESTIHEGRWDFSEAFPMPQWNVICPNCNASKDVEVESWSFHLVLKACTIAFKCTRCRNMIPFVTGVPDEMLKGVEIKSNYTKGEADLVLSGAHSRSDMEAKYVAAAKEEEEGFDFERGRHKEVPEPLTMEKGKSFGREKKGKEAK